MTSLAAAANSSDFRRSNHERSHSESSLWIDDYLNGEINAEDLFASPSKQGGINLLAPFEDGEDLQSALSNFIPECVFSEFDSVEPIDIETVDAEQLFRNATSISAPHIGGSSKAAGFELRRHNGPEADHTNSRNESCNPVSSTSDTFKKPSLPTTQSTQCNIRNTSSPKKATTVATTSSKWCGAHPLPLSDTRTSEDDKSKSKASSKNRSAAAAAPAATSAGKDQVVSKDAFVGRDRVVGKEKFVSRDRSVSKEKALSKEKTVSKEKAVNKEKAVSKEKIVSKEKSASKDKSVGKDKAGSEEKATGSEKLAVRAKIAGKDASATQGEICPSEQASSEWASSEWPANSSQKKAAPAVPPALLEKLKATSKKATRQSILILAPVTQQAAKQCVVSLDHDYCGDPAKGKRDDLQVQAMDVEPEHERADCRIEVLPDLRLAARATENTDASAANKVRTAHPRSLLRVNQQPGGTAIAAAAATATMTTATTERHVLEDCANFVVTEEVVITVEAGGASSDSGIESSVRVDEEDSDGSSRRWRDERSRKSRQQSPSLSDSSSVEGVSSRRNVSRRKRKSSNSSSSRRRTSRSRSPSPRRTYSSKRRRSYSRESSLDYNSDCRRSHAAGRYGSKAGRRNIWASSERPTPIPHMPPLNKPGQKTMMQTALEEIGRGGDRQVLYVGQIREGTTRHEIREKFDRFGPIAEVSVHFRETGENYAFVTFHRPQDAYTALEHAKLLPDFKLCFGGRRQFCGRRWSDLDNEQERAYMNTGLKDLATSHDDFDSLLKQVKTSAASLRR